LFEEKGKRRQIGTPENGGFCCIHASHHYIPATFDHGRKRPVTMKNQENLMFITEAFAQTATGTTGGGPLEILMSLAPFLLIFVVMYLLVIRPQRAQMKKREELLKNIRRGDQVVTAGGIVGKVAKVIDDKELEIEVAEGLKLRVVRTFIAEVRVKGEPVKE
jgi:preprotein translocase subunit YajC